MNVVKFLVSLCLCCVLTTQAAVKPLPVDQAFQLKAVVIDAQHVNLVWNIAPGYHLYSDAVSVAVAAPKTTQLGEWQLPDGKAGFDAIRGSYIAYYDRLTLPLTLLAGTTADLQLQVGYQGCADLGFCYPPQQQSLVIGTPSWGEWLRHGADASKIHRLLAEQSWPGIWLAFFVFGLLLAFTPCVFPMLPILSSIIVGQGVISTWRAFYLSCVYVMASALTYAVAGVAAGLAGDHWQNHLQNPWVLGGFGMVLIVLSLSLFGVYELQLPQHWQQRLDDVGRKQSRGRVWGVMVMGVISTLIVSPCVSAPLVGALAFISQRGSPWLGGSALWVMGLGMGLPLIVVGTSAGKWLPRAGRWMNQVKAFFGFSLVWLAILLWSRFIPAPLTLALWGTLAAIVAVYLGAFDATSSRFSKAVGLVVALYGACLIVGATGGAVDPWLPLAQWMPVQTAAAESQAAFAWQPVSNEAALETVLAQAVAAQRPVLIDFYADWCVSCKAMDRDVFGIAKVQQMLVDKHVLTLRIDVTQQNAEQQVLQRRFGVIAPPTLVSIDTQGVVKHTLVGEQSQEAVLQLFAS